MPNFVAKSRLLFFPHIHSHSLPIWYVASDQRGKSNRCFQGRRSETHTLIWLFSDFCFFGSNQDFFFFCSPSVKKERAPWENFSLLKSWEEYKVLVLWCVLPVCVHPLRSKKKGKKSAVCKLWLTDSWWLFVKLLKICLSPEHFCVYVSVLTSPIDHVSDYDQSASVS